LRYLDRMQPLGLLALRLTMGSIMVGHGWHKVNGHLHDFAGYVAGMAVPGWLGYVAAFVEFFGGILIIAGLLTRCVAFAFLIDMSVAIIKVHWPNFRSCCGPLPSPSSSSAQAPSRWMRFAAEAAADGAMPSRARNSQSGCVLLFALS